MSGKLSDAFRFVTEHNLLVLLLMLLVTGGVAAGTQHLQTASEANGSSAVGDTEVAQKADYIQANYGNHSDASDLQPAVAYVRSEDGNALSKSALLESLRYQQTVLENESVAAALGDREVVGVANVVAARAAGSPDATLDEQVTALDAASVSEVERLVAATLTEDSAALELLPSDFAAGTAAAESHRMVFRFADGESIDRSAATKALYDAAADHERPEVFTLGEHASADSANQTQENVLQLILPVALGTILAVLAFSYRDLVDVVVGFTGVVLSVLWMFGILGWLGIPAGMTMIIGPVLIVGLSVDYGLHVFMRYREQRGEAEGIREPMARGLSSVAVALALVTLTAAVGFMSNITNEFTTIKQLSVGITLGVASTFVVSVTLVPALKVTVDSLLERVGFDRRKAPLGETRLLEPLLASGATLARRAAPAVLVVALVAGSAGAVAWTDLDRQAFQQGDGEVAEWKQELPGPLAWEVPETDEHRQYVDANYRAADESDRRASTLLFEGDVATPATLSAVAETHDRSAESDVVFQRDGSVPMRSPLTVMRSVAAENDEFAQTYASADTDGDGVPDEDVAAVYDALFAAAPDRAGQVVERTDGGDGEEYRSLRAIVPISDDATYPEQADAIHDIESAVGADGVTVTAVGAGTINAAEAAQTAESILTTLVIALAAIGVLLTVVYRLVVGSATLGAVTALPITLVTALVVGGMSLLEVPLTLLTALLLSLVVGLGVDYNIHISDRFAEELERGRSVAGALRTAVTGTGGALLGSTLTSAGAFSALLLHPHPQIQSFGTLVVLALTLSFVVAVFVLPSVLATWARFFHPADARSETPASSPAAQD